MLRRTLTITALLLAFASLETAVPWAAALNWYTFLKWTVALGIVCIGIPAAVFHFSHPARLEQR